MKAVIMAGGFGTRLRPLTCNIPKPMVPVANRPIMEHIVTLLKKHNFKEMISILYFQPEHITEHFKDGKEFGIKMFYQDATEDFGTAGSVKNTEKIIGNSPFIIISGDVITDFNLTKAIKFHKEKKSKITIVLTRVKNPLEYGVVITDKKHHIQKFLEKPSWGEVFSDTINTGIYILEPEILDYIPEKTSFDFSKDLFPKLMKNNIPIYGYIAEGYWKDVGNINEYRKSHMDILAGEIDLRIRGTKMDKIGRDIRIGENTIINDSAVLKTSVIIGDNCEVGENVKIIDSIIGNNVTIKPDTTIKNSIIWDNVLIGNQAQLNENIICNNVNINDGAYILEGAVISDDVQIGINSTIKAGVKIWPEKIIDAGSIVDKSMIWGDRWTSKLFGAYGVTGIANVEITPEFAAKLGASYGAFLGKESTILISRDIFRASRMINRAFVTGLLSVGVNVNDLQTVPLPVMRYHLGKWNEKGGVHIRRSPFDSQLIDIKFYDENGQDLSTPKESSIERLFFREDFRRARHFETGSLNYPYRVVENYREGFMNEIDLEIIKEKGLKIVIDYSFGLATQIFPSILGKLGCEAISLNTYLDEEKITRTEKEFHDALTQMSSIVRTVEADVGFLIDAGAEKIFVSDDKGNILSGDDLLASYVYLISRKEKIKKICVPISASRKLDIMAKEKKFKVIRSKFNTRFMSLHAMEEHADFVGETKGGFMFPEFQPAFDGMISIAKFLEILSKNDKKLSIIQKEIPDSSFMVREHIFCPWEKKGEIMRRLVESEKKRNVQMIDGIKIFYKNDWVLIIPDADKALFHINAEASTIERARELVEKYLNIVSKIREE